MKVLLGVTGSIAAVLTEKLHDELVAAGHEVNIVITQSAGWIASGIPKRALRAGWLNDFWDGNPGVFNDKHEWSAYMNTGKVAHIELTKWADVLLIAPCTANTLAKLANGTADNLLTCCARAWHFDKPFFVALAMNTNMLHHPVTRQHIDLLRSWGIQFIDSQSKTLYCGDTGDGALADLSTIVTTINQLC